MFVLCLGPVVFVALFPFGVITFSSEVGIDIALLKISEVHMYTHLFGACFWVGASVISYVMLVK